MCVCVCVCGGGDDGGWRGAGVAVRKYCTVTP